MPVPSILYDEVGGGGDGTLDEFLDTLDTLRIAPDDYTLGGDEGLEEDPFDEELDEEMTDDSMVTVQTPALWGAALLPTFEGWWDFSSGDLENLGTAGSALDLTLGASGAAPTFDTDHYAFDGTDDYMYCADNDIFAMPAATSFAFGLVATPRGAIVNGDVMISHDAGGANSLFRLAQATGNLFVCTIADATTSNSTTGVATAVGTKALHVGCRNYLGLVNRTAKCIGTTVTSNTNTLSSTGGSVVNAATQFRIGSKGSGANFAEMDVFAAFFCRRALTDFELVAIAAYYGV
jgi:hypothetical protein